MVAEKGAGVVAMPERQPTIPDRAAAPALVRGTS